MAKESARMSAEERREAVLSAAIKEFARGGYAGTATAAIARRVGVSQPYLFRLFPDKRALFLAAAKRCTEEIRQVLLRAGEGAEDPEAARAAMGDAYVELVADRDRLMFQLQMYVAVHAAEVAGDSEFGAEVRASFRELWETVHLVLGGQDEHTWDFVSSGMLVNVLLALGFPPGGDLWGACDVFEAHGVTSGPGT
ncbi:TetR/AcrR family transcriptional regulator [Streptomyces sp. 7-21]|uniref:TetR/AcrR family transcriptional regulator n=1 Tax=Streptomyces sp. 7-21 TaxID=2802283 RepID=UPI001F26F314|nr:TetR/AcrR family transcriptional regulator [Streptomyces sp. 7-21]